MWAAYKAVFVVMLWYDTVWESPIFHLYARFRIRPGSLLSCCRLTINSKLNIRPWFEAVAPNSMVHTVNTVRSYKRIIQLIFIYLMENSMKIRDRELAASNWELSIRMNLGFYISFQIQTLDQGQLFLADRSYLNYTVSRLVHYMNLI